MRAAWWWIDRWLTSQAFLTMTLEEQGAYRNLIDQLWLRDGFLPDDDAVLAKASGAGVDWPRLKGKILAQFVRVPGGYRNQTHDGVQKESKRLSAKQKRYRDRVAGKGKATGHVASNVTTPVTGNVTGQVTSQNLRSLSPAEGDRDRGEGASGALPNGSPVVSSPKPSESPPRTRILQPYEPGFVARRRPANIPSPFPESDTKPGAP